MQLQTITQLGNSDAVIIPATLMKNIGLKRGQKVVVDRLGDTENLVIMTKPTKKISQSAVTAEFQTWLSSFLEEDKELLNDLAQR